MTYGEVLSMAAEAGLPYAYDHFAEGESPDPPFLVFLFPYSDNFGADDRVYQKMEVLRLELYTEKKDPVLEKRIEDVLDSHDLFYEREETWIETEDMYEVLYEMRVMINA